MTKRKLSFFELNSGYSYCSVVIWCQSDTRSLCSRSDCPLVKINNVGQTCQYRKRCDKVKHTECYGV